MPKPLVDSYMDATRNGEGIPRGQVIFTVEDYRFSGASYGASLTLAQPAISDQEAFHLPGTNSLVT
jgi:hypothetical protein